LRQIVPVCRVITWTKAPVHFSASQGAVSSQARKRTTRSPIRTAWPGFMINSRDRPFRLLRTPIVATRAGIGVSARLPGRGASALREGAVSAVLLVASSAGVIAAVGASGLS
jgi:hypothetical protein